MKKNFQRVSVAIIGAGSWGTALALTAKRAGSDVSVLTRSPYQGSILTDAQIPNFTDWKTPLSKAELIILAIPVQNTPEVLEKIKPLLGSSPSILIASKGIHIESKKFLSQIAEEVLPVHATNILSGPNFAHEIIKNLPAAATLAYTNKPSSELVVQAFSHPKFRLYMTTDTMGVQIGGALKNVIGIACGFLKALNLGENAAAALITRGLTEITSFALFYGAKAETLLGLSGAGDMMLTCMGGQSRNVRFGQEVIRLQSIDKALEAIGATVEGYFTAKAISDLSHASHIQMPICHAVYDILYNNKNPLKTLETLMDRPLRYEI